MNERIQELADRLWRVSPQDLDAMGLTYRKEFYEQELKKFAESIVRECADIAKHHVMNISTYADAEFVEEQVKQHFRVE